MDTVQQSIEAMALMPPHCPMNPHRYASFFNNSSKLPGGVAPYKLLTEKHARDGHPVQRLEYNNFYSNWKTDALKWYPQGSKEYDSTDGSGSGTSNDLPLPLPRDANLQLYEQTRRNNTFAVPLPTNGTNQVGILFNDKCQVPTFNYQRYAAQPVNNAGRFNNELYLEDISQKTQEQKAQYMNSIVQNSMDLYSSVFEDMYIMQMNPSPSDNLNYIRKA
jgi:hypothetical protein